MVEKQTGHKIKHLINDNRAEYLDGSFQPFLKNEGIIMDKTAAYTPQQSPISERESRTTTERARCMLIDANLPKKLWAEAVATAVYIENQSPEARVEFKTPHKLWYTSKPNLAHIQIFECAADKLITKQFRDSKFSPTSKKQILIGYQERLHNYRFLNPTNGQISYSHDIILNEENFSHQFSECVVLPSTPDLISEDLNGSSADFSPETPSVINQTPPDSPPSPEQTPPVPPRHISSSIDLLNIIKRRCCPRANTAFLPEPAARTYKQAMAGPNRINWEKAIQVELENITKHGVFTVVELPKGAKLVGTTWAFREKWAPTGVFIKHKARLCSQGFTKVKGINYEEM